MLRGGTKIKHKRKSRKPNVLVCGFPRCGTTYLWKLLRQHPDVTVSEEVKNLDAFQQFPLFLGAPTIRNFKYDRSYDQYLSHFKTPNKVVIDFAERAAYDLNSWKKIKRYLGKDVQIIFLVRNPQQHKISMYKLLHSWGMIPNTNYEYYHYNIEPELDYSNFDKWTQPFKKHFKNVSFFQIADNKDSHKEVLRLIEHLELEDFDFNFDVHRYSREQIPPRTAWHTLKRKIILTFPNLLLLKQNIIGEKHA